MKTIQELLNESLNTLKESQAKRDSKFVNALNINKANTLLKPAEFYYSRRNDDLFWYQELCAEVDAKTKEITFDFK